MADQGFKSFEDNEMRNRPLALQEKMAKTMSERGMKMLLCRPQHRLKQAKFRPQETRTNALPSYRKLNRA